MLASAGRIPNVRQIGSAWLNSASALSSWPRSVYTLPMVFLRHRLGGLVVRLLFDGQGLVEAVQRLLHLSRLPVQIAKGNQLNPFIAHAMRRARIRELLFMLDDLILYRRTLRAGRRGRKQPKAQARNRLELSAPDSSFSLQSRVRR